MPTSAEIVEYLASEGLLDIQPWHDAGAISATDPLTLSQLGLHFAVARVTHDGSPRNPASDPLRRTDRGSYW